jgi:hypothetical protein
MVIILLFWLFFMKTIFYLFFAISVIIVWESPRWLLFAATVFLLDFFFLPAEGPPMGCFLFNSGMQMLCLLPLEIFSVSFPCPPPPPALPSYLCHPPPRPLPASQHSEMRCEHSKSHRIPRRK